MAATQVPPLIYTWILNIYIYICAYNILSCPRSFQNSTCTYLDRPKRAPMQHHFNDRPRTTDTPVRWVNSCHRDTYENITLHLYPIISTILYLVVEFHELILISVISIISILFPLYPLYHILLYHRVLGGSIP